MHKHKPIESLCLNWVRIIRYCCSMLTFLLIYSSSCSCEFSDIKFQVSLNIWWFLQEFSVNVLFSPISFLNFQFACEWHSLLFMLLETLSMLCLWKRALTASGWLSKSQAQSNLSELVQPLHPEGGWAITS